MALFVQCRRVLIEPTPALEIACSGLGRIEFLGSGQACYALYRNAVAVDSGDQESHICGRIFAPLEAMLEATELMRRAMAEIGSSTPVLAFRGSPKL